MIFRRLLSKYRYSRLNTIFQKNKTRNIIIHNHVFKNAGSTIDWALRKNFGNNFVDHRDDKEMQKGSEYLRAFLLDNKKISALSTHHLCPPLPEVNGLNLITIMMFRHPIERVTSVYNFEKKQSSSNTLGARYARDHSLKDYIIWRMDFDVPPTIRNFHVFRTLPAPVDWREKITLDALEKAKTYVDSLELIGLVERFDESMVLFEHTINDLFPYIDFSYTAQNIGQKDKPITENRIKLLKDTIGEKTFTLLEEQNSADLELYEHAKKIFNERLINICDLDAKIENLKNRCRRWDVKFK